MGYNLKRLMNQYGVSTASKAGYAGAKDPGPAPEAPIFTMQVFPEGSPEAIERAKRAKEYQDALTVYQPKKDAYDADKAAYDAYSGSYDNRLQGTPMYAAKQFQTKKQIQPQNFDELFDKYLNSNSTAEQVLAGNAAIQPYIKIDTEGNDGIQLTNPQAARNAFIQGIAPTLGTGIGNTGNQAIMEQSGKYYGNVLKNPIYGTTSTGVGATNTVDGTTSILDDPDLDLSGVTGSDDLDLDLSGVTEIDDSAVIDAAENDGLDTVGGFGNDVITNVNTNDDDPSDYFTKNPINTDNNLYGDNSFTEDLANLFTPFDGASYVDGVLTTDEANFVPGSTPVDESDIGDGGTYSGSGNSDWNDPGYDSASDTDSFISGGGADGIGEWGVVGDFFGGIGDSLGITNYSGVNDDNEDEGGGWSWWKKGGAIKGYAQAGEVIVDDESLEEVTDVPSLDELALANLNNVQDSNTNIAALQRMLANSAMPSSTATSDARAALDTARADFSAMLQRSADTAAQGPSESEKWFRLAAAFGKPTQSGHFMENLGLANEALAGFKSDKRAAQSASDALLMQGAEFNLGYLKDDLAAATAAGAAERDWKRGLAAELLEYERNQLQKVQDREFDLAVIAGEREYEAGKPKSTAAKIATDMGLEGAAYNSFIEEYYEREQAVAALELEALTKQVDTLSTGELNLKADTQTQIESAESSLALLDKALELNEIAFSKSFYDSSKTAFLGAMDPENPQYIATMELEQILSSNALASLKSTFGGQISDGERKSLSALQGIEAKSSEERERIIRNAAEALASILSKRRIKLEQISSGEYGRKTPSSNTGDE